METINTLKNNQELFEKFSKLNCKVTYNNKLIYEGIYNENNIDINKYNNSQIVYDFPINDQHILFLGENNENIDKLNKLFENREFEDIYNDAKLFNKAMNLANKLPLYNFNKELFEDNINKNIRKYGINFQKIFENLLIKEIDKTDNTEE
jgi:fructose 1,6-bisphosphatase